MSALTEALVAAQAELPTAIGRDSQGQGYRYTSLDSLIEATRPILTKHGLAITQWPTYVVVGDELRPALATRITHASADVTSYLPIQTGATISESIEYIAPLYVTEKTMQGFGAAITYARRYAWAAALGIASEEDTDGTTLPDPDDVPF